MLIWTRDGNGGEMAKKMKERMDGLKGAGWVRGSVGFLSRLAGSQTARFAPNASTSPLKFTTRAVLNVNTLLSCSRAESTSSSVPLLAC